MRIHKRKQTFERITLIGPMAEAKKWINWCYDNEYGIIRSGPKSLRPGYVSKAKFKIVAEREVKK